MLSLKVKKMPQYRDLKDKEMITKWAQFSMMMDNNKQLFGEDLIISVDCHQLLANKYINVILMGGLLKIFLNVLEFTQEEQSSLFGQELHIIFKFYQNLDLHILRI
jgi:hypothetical protein